MVAPWRRPGDWAGRDNISSTEDDRHRAVVDEIDLHRRPERAARNRQAERRERPQNAS